CIAPRSYARSTPEKLGQAAYYFEEAERMLLELQQTPPEKRTLRQYEAIIQNYRRVYRVAPTSFRNPKALLAIGELYQGMAYDLKKPKYYTAAIDAYDFLMQEYPYSTARREALLQTAQIYYSSLRQTDEARKRFQRVLDKFPATPQAEEARVALAE